MPPPSPHDDNQTFVDLDPLVHLAEAAEDLLLIEMPSAMDEDHHDSTPPARDEDHPANMPTARGDQGLAKDAVPAKGGKKTRK